MCIRSVVSSLESGPRTFCTYAFNDAPLSHDILVARILRRPKTSSIFVRCARHILVYIYIRARSRIKRRRYAFRIVVDGCRAHSFLSLNPPLPSHDVRQFGRELLARARAAFCFFRTSPSVCVCVCTRHHTIAVDHTACLITGPPFVYGTKPIRPTYRVVDTGWGTEGDCSTGIVWIFRSGTKRDLIRPNVPIYGNFSRRTRTRNISLFESNNRIDFRSIPVHE